MPVPDFDHNGVLPPHLGNHAQDSSRMAPYTCTSVELVDKLCTSNDRRNILYGLFELRDALRLLGINQGFQWLDGSFTEDVENRRGGPPGDIDVITFYQPLSAAPTAAPALAVLAVLVDRAATKSRYRVDHIFVPLASHLDRVLDAHRIVDNTRYWFGLFSHRRSDDVWKGMLRLELDAGAG